MFWVHPSRRENDVRLVRMTPYRNGGLSYPPRLNSARGGPVESDNAMHICTKAKKEPAWEEGQELKKQLSPKDSTQSNQRLQERAPRVPTCCKPRDAPSSAFQPRPVPEEALYDKPSKPVNQEPVTNKCQMDIINAENETVRSKRIKKSHRPRRKKNEKFKNPREEGFASQMAPYVGCIIVQVAASQLTSSKLCNMLNPIEERQSKLPSPSTWNNHTRLARHLYSMNTQIA